MPPPPPVARPSRPGTSPWGRTRTPCRRPSVGRPGPRRPPSPGDRRPSLIPPFNARGDSCSSKGACSRISAFPDTGRNPCPRVPYGPSGTFDASLMWTLPHMAPAWHCASPGVDAQDVIHTHEDSEWGATLAIVRSPAAIDTRRGRQTRGPAAALRRRRRPGDRTAARIPQNRSRWEGRGGSFSRLRGDPLLSPDAPAAVRMQ